MPVPSNPKIYRMVHWQNVEYILRNGLCSREHESADPNYINIGHRQLIEDRHTYPVKLDNAGNLGEYVPFYFAGHTPMLYLIMNGYKGVQQRSQEDIVFLVSAFEKIKAAGLEFVFANMNAKLALAEFFREEKDLDQIDWTVVKSQDWRNTENDRTRRDLKQAEFLVRNFVPVSCITALVVKTESRKVYFDELIAKLGINLSVYIDKDCKLYY